MTRHLRRDRWLLPLAGIALVWGLVAADVALAQDGDGSFEGGFRIGFREISIDGSEDKYNEDYNIDDGPRLFDLFFDFAPGESGQKLVDRVELDVTNLGGDAFETIRIGARNFGSWKFDYNRRKSNYFYHDIILPPELANVRLSSGGDFHTFDFDRVQDTADLTVDLSEAATLRLGFDRFTKTGESTTTLDLQRDEFEFDKPVDETLSQYRAGLEYRWDKLTLALEEDIRKYDNAYSIFLPGFSQGENPDNLTTLDFFFLDQPYDSTSLSHTVRLRGKPTTRFSFGVSARMVSLDLDVEATEESQGTSFNGSLFTTDDTGSGEIERDADLIDVDLSYLVNEQVAVIARVWSHSLDQEGDFTFAGDLNQGQWDIETAGVDAGVEIGISPQLSVTVGLRSEERDVEHAVAEAGGPLEEEDIESTDQTGYFGSLHWRPNQSFRLDLEAEDSSYDDPFTLASPTDRQRYRLRGRYRFGNGFSVTGSLLRRTFENSNSGWDADLDQANLTLAYSGNGVNASLGWASSEQERSIEQLVSPTDQLFPIFFASDADYLTARFDWKANEHWRFGGNGLVYDNDGSFALDRSDVGAFVEAALGSTPYRLRLGYRVVDYDEDRFDFDDYDADIVDFSVGYRW